MKRGFLAVLLLLLFTFSVGATSLPTDQVIELREELGTLSIVTTEPTTFWEAPDLIAGETITVDGTLTLKNSTDEKRVLTLSLVELPFDDPQAMEYLNHLHLTVQRGEEVIYNDQYSRINDGSTPLISILLEAGESASYTLSLKCDYTYVGTDGLGDAIINWKFVTPLDDESSADQAAPAFSDPLLREVLIAAVLTAIVLAVLYFVRQRRR